MAFSNAVLDIFKVGDGLIREVGTWNGASVTTGTITAATTGRFPAGAYITDIVGWGASSDGDTAVTPATDIAPNKLKLTFTSSDTGKYWIEGRAK